jgi:hypothetical protein
MDLLTIPEQGDAVDIVMDYLRSNAGSFRVTSEDLENFVVSYRYTTNDTGVTHVYLQQTFNNLLIHGANVNANVTADGRVISIGTSFMTGVKGSNTQDGRGRLRPILGPVEAIDKALQRVGLPTIDGPIDVDVLSDGPDRAVRVHNVRAANRRVDALLHYVPVAEGTVELA